MSVGRYLERQGAQFERGGLKEADGGSAVCTRGTSAPRDAESLDGLFWVDFWQDKVMVYSGKVMVYLYGGSFARSERIYYSSERAWFTTRTVVRWL